MTPETFAAWVAHMRGLGYPQYRAAEMLGVRPDQIVRWKKRGTPRYVGLACAAIAAKLEPWEASEPRV